MSDIHCAVCGEPWDAWGDFSDMKRWEAALFKQGAGCPTCEGVGDAGDTDDENAPPMRHMRDVLLSGATDDPCAFACGGGGLPDAATRPAWAPPPDVVLWECAGCKSAVMREGDPEDPEDAFFWRQHHSRWKYHTPVGWEDACHENGFVTLGGEKYCPACVTTCEDCGKPIFTDAVGDTYDEGHRLPDPRDEYRSNGLCIDCYEAIPTCEHCGEYCGDEGEERLCCPEHKGREPSTVCAILDDCAALGDAARLFALSDAWDNKPSLEPLASHISNAAHARGMAVDARMAGDINRAVEFERRSESCLTSLRPYGTRDR